MNPNFVEILKAFRHEAVEHLVGAHALAAHGHVCATFDIDIGVKPTVENAGRIWQALQRCRDATCSGTSVAFASRQAEPGTPAAGSIRLANLGGGLEDYEYLWALGTKRGGVWLARADCEPVTSSLTAFTRDPAALQHVRARVARELDEPMAGVGEEFPADCRPRG